MQLFISCCSTQDRLLCEKFRSEYLKKEEEEENKEIIVNTDFGGCVTYFVTQRSRLCVRS